LPFLLIGNWKIVLNILLNKISSRLAYILFDMLISIPSKLLHSRKEKIPILVTLAGIIIFNNFMQFQNAKFPIEATLFPSDMLDNAKQFSNVNPSTDFTF